MAATLTLPSGNKIPVVAFGLGAARKTSFDQSFVDSVRLAIQNGWRHFDAAESYGTDSELGVALSEFIPSKIPREEFFITTKVHSSLGIAKGDIEGALKAELAHLKLDYVDLYLVHSPFFSEGISIQDVWAQMESVKAKGLARDIGISNFGPAEIDKLLAIAKIKPVVNQIEMHPYVFAQDRAIVETCKKNNIIIAGYAPLMPIGRHKDGPVADIVQKIAKKHGVSPAQVLLRWQTQKGFIVVTSSGQSERQKQQIDLEGFSLDDTDIKNIEEGGASHPFRFFGWGVWKKEYSGVFI